MISDIPYYSPQNFHPSPLLYSNLFFFNPSLVQAWATYSYLASKGRSMSTSPSSSLSILPHPALCLLPQRAALPPTRILNRHLELRGPPSARYVLVLADHRGQSQQSGEVRTWRQGLVAHPLFPKVRSASCGAALADEPRGNVLLSFIKDFLRACFYGGLFTIRYFPALRFQFA